MKTQPKAETAFRADQLQAAKRLGLPLHDLSSTEVDKMIADAFYKQNAKTVDAMNSWVERNGIPLQGNRVW